MILAAAGAPIPPGLVPWLPPLAIGWYLVVMYGISRQGWRGLARRYSAGATGRPAGRAFTVPRADFGSMFSSYSNVVRVIFTEEGVCLYVRFYLRPFHPPLLVPWKKVVRVQEKKHFFMGRHFNLEVETFGGSFYLWLPQSLEQDLCRYLPEGRMERVEARAGAGVE